jgi:hypothetical protein
MVRFFDRQRFDQLGINAVQLEKYALFLGVMAVVTAMFTFPTSIILLFVNSLLLSVAFIGAYQRHTRFLLIVWHAMTAKTTMVVISMACADVDIDLLHVAIHCVVCYWSYVLCVDLGHRRHVQAGCIVGVTAHNSIYNELGSKWTSWTSVG